MLHHQNSHASSFSQPMFRRDFISLLPKNGLDHVAENILSYLDAKSLSAAELVCKEWYQVISEGRLWKKIIERRVRTDSLWRGLMERRGSIKYLFKLSPAEPHPNHMFYRRLYTQIIQDIESIETNWRCGLYTLKRINCHSENSKGACCVEYDDHKIVSGLSDNTIKIWDRNTLQCIQVLTGHTGPVVCLQYDDRVIISGSSDDLTVRFWDVKTGELIKTLCPYDPYGFHLRFNKSIYAIYDEDTIWTLYDKDSLSGTKLHRIFINGRGAVISIIDFDQYWTTFRGRTIKVYDYWTMKLVRTLEGHKRNVLCLQYSSRLLVSGSMDKTIRLWDFKSGACLRTLKGHKDFVSCIQFDNKRIVSGARDGEIKVWDLAAALDPHAPTKTSCLQTLVGHSGRVTTLRFDDFQIVSSSNDDTIVIWDFLNGTPPKTRVMSMCNVLSIIFRCAAQQIQKLF